MFVNCLLANVRVLLQGFRVVPASDCWNKSLKPLMTEVRSMMGSGPVYLSFDIDSLDPCFAPGTGKLQEFRICVEKKTKLATRKHYVIIPIIALMDE